MERDPLNRRRIGIAACITALVLLGAALIVGKLVYSEPSAPLVRLASHDAQGR